MTMRATLNLTPDALAIVADEVARSLSYAQSSNGLQQIVTPLLYPSGACVVLRLDASRDGYFVSDAGAGRREAELMGGDRIYARIASNQAKRHAVNFDSDLIFDIEVPKDALVAAVVAVANASKEAVRETAERLSERKSELQRERLWRTLFGVFPRDRIIENAEFAGRSETWKFDALVQAERPMLFHTVAPNPISAQSAVARFLDVKDSGGEETVRVSVATSLTETPHLQLLSRTSRVIQIDAPKVQFEQLQVAA
jgi:hypothetical protein